ncbi:MAG: DNA/RNA nuclease SfsA [Caulobacteraceae bacterium]|nr:DNA/RNA nuclease SfsA [Caulobacter sp.]
MRFPQPLTRARLVRRYKRFLADVVIEGEAGETTVHVPNPGAMLGLADPGLAVWLSRSPSATRKLPWTLELVEADGGLVGINTMLPNRLVAEALAAGAIPEVAGYARRRPEVRYGEASRVDFLLEDDHRPRCWLEVKNVHLMRTPGLAEFPDCRAARSSKHLRGLEATVAAGDRAVMLFVVQRTDCDRFDTAADLDPLYAADLRRASAAGVEVLCRMCDIAREGVAISRPIPWTPRA